MARSRTSFRKGQSGNPKGRKSVDPVVKEDLKGCLVRKFGENGEVLLDRLDAAGKLSGRLAPVALQANMRLLAYLVGNPIERKEVTGKDGAPLLDVPHVSVMVLRERILALLAQLPSETSATFAPEISEGVSLSPVSPSK